VNSLRGIQAGIAFFYLIFSSGICAGSEAIETQYSRFGELVLKKDFENGSSISRDGRVIFESPKLEYLSINEIIATKRRDYLIVSQNLGGSGTPDVYSIIAIGPSSFVKIYPGVELTFNDGKVAHRILADGIEFALDDEGIYKRFALIERDNLTVQKKQMDRPKSLDVSSCQYLFTSVLSECATARGSQCRSTLGELSMANQRGLTSISRNIFFPAQSFSAMCDAVCISGYVWLQYPEFSKSICYFN